MYHSAKNFTMRNTMMSFLCAALVGSAQAASGYADQVPLASQTALTGKLNFVTADFPGLPVNKALKRIPRFAQVYQWDDKPLGDRSPFLFVHGLRGEYYPTFRYAKIIKKFTSNPEFDGKYKVYLLRHDSLSSVNETVPQFRNAIASLYNAAQKRPITVLALSIGGNLVYEGMHDRTTDDSIRLAFTLGTPFRGSPLFCMDWLQYSVYKNLSFPWTRIDHSLAYKYYFNHNPGLVKDFGWDNSDDSIPNVGPFHSKLPLGPHGDLTIGRDVNKRLAELNSQPFDKKKLITYSGYLLNPFMLPEMQRKIDTTVMAPYTILTIQAPAHIGREHPVLKWLNRDIGTIIPSKEAQLKTGSQFVYQLNDGITPVASAVFLPQEACASAALVRETELPKLKSITDVHLARVFRNIDHLTFIDGYRPLNASSQIRDEMDPDAGSKHIFDWMLSDLLQFDQSSNKIARE
jgi:hypothetical protein